MKTAEEYQPFGEEWKNELMKMPKIQIIALYRQLALAHQELQQHAKQYCEEKMKEQMLKFLIWFKTEVARNGALLSVLDSNDDIMNGFLDQTNKQ